MLYFYRDLYLTILNVTSYSVILSFALYFLGDLTKTQGSCASMNLGVTNVKKHLRLFMRRRFLSISQEDIDKQTNTLCDKLIASDEYKNAQSICFFLSMPHEVSIERVLCHALSQQKKCFAPRVYDQETMLMLRVYSVQDYKCFKKSSWGIPEPSLRVSRALVDPLQPFVSYENNIPDLIREHPSLATGGAVSTDIDIPKDEFYREEATNWANFQSVAKKWDLEKSTAQSQSSVVDLILMPAMAVDTYKNRLGYGRGYYDRYLNRLCAKTQKMFQLRASAEVNEQKTSAALASTPLPQTIAIVLDQQVLRQTDLEEAFGVLDVGNNDNNSVETKTDDTVSVQVVKDTSVYCIPSDEYDYHFDKIFTAYEEW